MHNTDRKSIAFFNSNGPKSEDIRALHPSYVTAVGVYSMELKCRGICNESDEIMNSSCYLYVRACLNVVKFETPLSLTQYLPSDSPHLMLIWKSLNNYNKPYDVNALEIKFPHSVLTGQPDFESVLRHETDKRLKLIIEVWVGGTEGDHSPPIRTSYTTYSVHKLLDAAGYYRTNNDSKNPIPNPWSKYLTRNFIRVAHLKPPDEESEESEGFFSKVFNRKKKNMNSDDDDDDDDDKSEKGKMKKELIVNNNNGKISHTNMKKNFIDQTPPKEVGQQTPFAILDKDEKLKIKNEIENKELIGEEIYKKPWYSRKTLGATVTGHGEVSHFDAVQPSTDDSMKTANKSFSLFSRPYSLKNSKKAEYEKEKKLKEEKDLIALKDDNQKGTILSLNDVGNIARRGSVFNSLLEKKTGEETSKNDDQEKVKKPVVAIEVTAKEKKIITKKVKKRESKINADFEREMVAATTYRDPFFER